MQHETHRKDEADSETVEDEVKELQTFNVVAYVRRRGNLGKFDDLRFRLEAYGEDQVLAAWVLKFGAEWELDHIEDVELDD